MERAFEQGRGCDSWSASAQVTAFWVEQFLVGGLGCCCTAPAPSPRKSWGGLKEKRFLFPNGWQRSQSVCTKVSYDEKIPVFCKLSLCFFGKTSVIYVKYSQWVYLGTAGTGSRDSKHASRTHLLAPPLCVCMHLHTHVSHLCTRLCVHMRAVCMCARVHAMHVCNTHVCVCTRVAIPEIEAGSWFLCPQAHRLGLPGC